MALSLLSIQVGNILNYHLDIPPSQVFRRLYECAFINQPSPSTMNITHYIVGYAHYFCTATGFLCEAPGFEPGVSSVAPGISVSSVSWAAWGAAVVFLGAWYHQLQAHKIFAQLKLKNSNKHSIPEGGLFQLGMESVIVFEVESMDLSVYIN